MGDDDLWRSDGSFRGLGGREAKGGGGGKGGGKGGGPQFTRVIPKFLRQFHEPPAVQAKFAPAPQPPGEEDGDDDGILDDVQQAAMDEYLKKQQEKKAKKNAVEGRDETNKITKDARPKKQKVAGLGGAADGESKKRKRKKEMKTLSNKKLLSFSMDDEEGA